MSYLCIRGLQWPRCSLCSSTHTHTHGLGLFLLARMMHDSDIWDISVGCLSWGTPCLLLCQPGTQRERCKLMFKGEERHTLTKNTMRHTVGGEGEVVGGGVQPNKEQPALKKDEDVKTSSCITASHHMTDRRPLRPFPAAAMPPYQMSLCA